MDILVYKKDVEVLAVKQYYEHKFQCTAFQGMLAFPFMTELWYMSLSMYGKYKKCWSVHRLPLHFEHIDIGVICFIVAECT